MSDKHINSLEQTAHGDDVYNTSRQQGGLINKLYPPGPQPGARSRVKNHCRKFWWCDCFVVAIVVLVIVLPIIYVAIPNKAQDEINASTLEVTSQQVSDPEPDRIHLKLESVIRSDSMYHPTVDSFRAGLTLEGQSQPFIYINIPEAKSENENKVTVDETVELSNLEAFSKYTTAVLDADTFNVHLNGKTKVHLTGLPAYNVDYNKKVSMKGLNKLQGLNITDVKILSGQKELLPDGSNMIGTVHIPNPSVMSLNLGNVTMNLAIGDKSIGYALVPNFQIKPGDNSLPMQAHVDQLAVLSLVSSKYKNATIPLTITGNSSINNAGKELKYYTEALKSSAVNVNLDIGPALAGIGINPSSVS